jgi:hypothetical protein
MGETPLVRAAHNGHLAAVQMLLARGADVEAADLVRLYARARAPICAARGALAPTTRALTPFSPLKK